MAANDWSERTKLIVTIAVALVINVAVFAWLYTIYQDYQKLEATRLDNVKKIKTLHADTDNLEARQTELATKEKEVEKRMKKLPEEEQTAKMIDDIAKIATKDDCTQKSLSITAGTTPETLGGGSYYKDVYHTSWDADFFGWCKLMNEMEENFERFVSFQNLVLTPKNSGVVSTGSKHQISVDLVIYRYVPAPK